MADRGPHEAGTAGDDALRTLLRDADPAGDLPPLDGYRTERLLEDTMSQTTPPPRHAPTEPTTRGLRSAPWVAAAAVVVLTVGGVAWAGTRGGEDSAQAGPATSSPAPSTAPPSAQADEQADEQSPGGVTTTLGVDAAPSARCMVPSAEVLAHQQVAVEATVVEITDSEVRLRAEDWYAGGSTPYVVVDAQDPSLVDLVLGADFTVGERYLVSATDGQVSLCGFSGPATPRLRALYVTAFR